MKSLGSIATVLSEDQRYSFRVFQLLILIHRLVFFEIEAHLFSKDVNCLSHLKNRQPTIGHHLLRIDSMVNDENQCQHRCSVENSCSMASFHQRKHRCHLFESDFLSRPSQNYRSNFAYSTFVHCPIRFLGQIPVSSTVCDYDSLPWQRVKLGRSLTFKSYKLIGVSILPCQNLCSAVRHCAAVQYQTRGENHHRCRLLRSAKPWELVPSRTWTIFVKRFCHIEIHPIDLLSRDDEVVCRFHYIANARPRRKIVRIHSFRPLSEIHCQYICSKMIHCLAIEYVERRSKCFLLSTNLLRNDGSIDIKRHRTHQIHVKVACGPFVVSKDLSGCSNVGPRRCLNGHCSFQLSEKYPQTICQCSRGFTGDLCDQPI